MWSHAERLAAETARNGLVIPSQPIVLPPIAPKPETPKSDKATKAKSDQAEREALLMPIVSMSGYHFQVIEVVKEMILGQYPFMWGSPGSGKTHLALQMAEALNLPCLIVTCTQDMSLTATITGALSPINQLCSMPQFRALFTNGGIVIFDEVGNAPGSFLNAMNSAIEQKRIDFPDGMSINMHHFFFALFADNTPLWGQNPRYPEREDVGSAFRNRLSYIEYLYDETIERNLVQNILEDTALTIKWHKLVLKARAICDDKTVPVSASPRISIKGARSLKWDIDHNIPVTQESILRVFKRYLWEGLAADQIGEALDLIKASPEFMRFPAQSTLQSNASPNT